MIYKTQYIITKDELIVKLAFITNAKIQIKDINKIEKSTSLVSAPALSSDRLLIRYKTSDELLISPKEKQEFINALMAINPNIELKL
jgi:hypothetical protein